MPARRRSKIPASSRGARRERSVVGRVIKLVIYPVKSLRGCSLEASSVTARGLANDRRWMVVSPILSRLNSKRIRGTHRFLSQRSCPVMATMSAKLRFDGNGDAEGIMLEQHRPGEPLPCASLYVPLIEHSKKSSRLTVEIWNDVVPGAIDQGDKVGRFLAECIGRPNLRLVYMPDDCVRGVDPKYDASEDNSSIVSFADGMPILLASEASMDALNRRMPGTAMPIDRFRPNIVIESNEPFAEDDWKTIKVNEVTYHVAKPCTRCKLPSTDQVTGVQTGFYSEPLQTLRTFRANAKGDMFFGQNLVPAVHVENETFRSSMIRVGDSVELVELKSCGSTFRKSLGRAPESAFGPRRAKPRIPPLLLSLMIHAALASAIVAMRYLGINYFYRINHI